MKKRGQLTIFIIVSLVVLGMAAAFFALGGSLGVGGGLTADGQRVYNFVDSCLTSIGNDAVLAVGYGGGYVVPPEPRVEELGIPYYYSNNKSRIPTKAQIGGEISNYVKSEMPYCIKNFAAFSDLNVTSDEISANAEIQSGKIILSVNYPLTVSKGDSKSSLENFKKEIPVRLGIIYDSIAPIIAKQTVHDGICLSCIQSLALENDLYANIFDYDNETAIFVFRDDKSKINNASYEFVFADKY